MPKGPDVLDPDDVLGEVVGEIAPVIDSGTGAAFVCDVVTDTGVCGETFDTSMKLGSHRWHRHRIRGEAPTARQKRGEKAKKPSRSRRAPAAKATTVAVGPPTDRAAVYTASLSMGAIAAYLALPPFDQRDLDICNAGLPNVGRALAQLADTNPSVARTCDLILAGGGGGWIALLMAVVPIAGGIAANHGVIPASSGDRFGEMIGMVPAGSVQRDAGVESPPPTQPGPGEVDVVSFFAGTPDTPLADATDKMMQMGGPVAVRVPMTPMENPDGHRGSEQLRPVPATDEAAEPEPESALSQA